MRKLLQVVGAVFGGFVAALLVFTLALAIDIRGNPTNIIVATVVASVNGVINPIAIPYLADPNSAADQTTAIQTAATACVAAGNAGTMDMRAFQQLTTNTTIVIGGCHLLLGAFTWTMNGTGGKVLTYDNGAEIAGAGVGRSILKMANGITETAHAVQNVNRTVGAKGVYFHDFTWDGNRSRTYSCVLASSTTVNCAAADTNRAPFGAYFLPTDVGKNFTGASIPASTTIAAVVSPTQITLSAAATATLTETDTIGSTTGSVGAAIECGGTGTTCEDFNFNRVEILNHSGRAIEFDTQSRRIYVENSRLINNSQMNANAAAIYLNDGATNVSYDLGVYNSTIDASAVGSSVIKFGESSSGHLDGAWVINSHLYPGDGGSGRTACAETVTTSGAWARDIVYTGNVCAGPNTTNTNIFGLSVGSSNGSTDATITGNIIKDTAGSVAIEDVAMDRVTEADNVLIDSGNSTVDATGMTSTTGTSANGSNCLSSVASTASFFAPTAPSGQTAPRGTRILCTACGAGGVDAETEITSINTTVNCDGTGGAGGSFTVADNMGAAAVTTRIYPVMHAKVSGNSYYNGQSANGDIQVATGTNKGAVRAAIVNNRSFAAAHRFVFVNAGATPCSSVTIDDNQIAAPIGVTGPDSNAITVNTCSQTQVARNRITNWPSGVVPINLSGAGTGNRAIGNNCFGASTSKCVTGFEPTASTGTASVTAGSLDTSGILVASASVTAAASITLKGVYGVAMRGCWCNDQNRTQTLIPTETTTTLTCTAQTDLGGDTIEYGCPTQN